MAALSQAGHRIILASRLRSFSRMADASRLDTLRREAAGEVSLLCDAWSSEGPKADLWLTYHPYYKAPDLIGPAVAVAFDIPYVTIEASHAPKRNDDGWANWQALLEAGLQTGALHISMTERDRCGLKAFLGEETRLAMLPPFIDVSPVGRADARPDGATLRFIAVAMMRPGDKLSSYRFLADALRSLQHEHWELAIIGDGPARPEVEASFADFAPGKIAWLGELPPADVHHHLARSDVYLWPGFNEAYGLAYLEAQAQGLPVLALDCGGIASVVEHGRTGLLIPEASLAEETLAAYRSAIMMLLKNRDGRLAMGDAARRFVHEERSLPRAAASLDAVLKRALRV